MEKGKTTFSAIHHGMQSTFVMPIQKKDDNVIIIKESNFWKYSTVITLILWLSTISVDIVLRFIK